MLAFVNACLDLMAIRGPAEVVIQTLAALKASHVRRDRNVLMECVWSVAVTISVASVRSAMFTLISANVCHSLLEIPTYYVRHHCQHLLFAILSAASTLTALIPRQTNVSAILASVAIHTVRVLQCRDVRT